MTDYFSGWNVGVDPEQSELEPNGSLSQEITLVLSDESRGSEARPPVAVTLSPGRSP